MPPVHDDNPDPADRGQRPTHPGNGGGSRAIRRAPAAGDVVGRASRPGGGSYDDDDDEGPSAADLERFGGETKPCPSCRKEVFDDTAICYHCGHAFERESADSGGKTQVWIAVTVGVLVLIFVFLNIGGII